MIVCLDTNILIYYIEGDTAWRPKVDQKLKQLIASGNRLATSDAARLECFVGPLIKGDLAVLADYQDLFNSSGLQMLPVTSGVWDRAATIRAQYKIQALDAIHLASAVEHGCSLFLTNDIQLRVFHGIAMEILT